ncbi:TPA: hypothetical protein I9094_002572 [Clostridium perfringens]|nr:hypothetical protein [Clostridium perfringens]HAT4347211.1 hypothetical protein [Clostridium perfringens]
MIVIKKYDDLISELQKDINDELIQFIRYKLDLLYINYEKNEDFFNIGISKIIIIKEEKDLQLINKIFKHKKWVDKLIIGENSYLNICIETDSNYVIDIYYLERIGELRL